MEQVQPSHEPLNVSRFHGNEVQEAFLLKDDVAHPSQPANKPTRALATSISRHFTERLGDVLRKRWTLEACSCLFAVLSLVGLALTLWVHRDKPLPEWPQLISLNSILSIFALLMRTSLGLVLAEGISQMKWQWFCTPHKLVDMQRFDSASRGSWGSVQFLYHLGWKRQAWIATLGALVTITTPLIGLFVQQGLEFGDCLQRDGAIVPLLAKTNSYEFSGDVSGANGHGHLYGAGCSNQCQNYKTRRRPNELTFTALCDWKLHFLHGRWRVFLDRSSHSELDSLDPLFLLIITVCTTCFVFGPCITHGITRYYNMLN